MTTEKTYRQATRCGYIKVCYLADALQCFGFKTDCVLYQKTNGEKYSEDRFHEAMDKLIDKTKAKHEKIPL
jgi:hypothetical protein